MRKAAVAIVFMLSLGSAVFDLCQASTVTVDDGSNSYRNIAANDPSNGNVWTSMSQSFVATNRFIHFGFRLKDGDESLPDAGTRISYDLYSGANIYGRRLATRTVVLPSRPSSDPRSIFGDVGFVDADFSDVMLNVGSTYTIRIRMSSSTPLQLGSYTPIGVWTSNENPYKEGRFFFPVGYDNRLFADDDMLFHMQPAVSTPAQAAFALADDVQGTFVVPAEVRLTLASLAYIAGIDFANRTPSGTQIACQVMDLFIAFAETASAQDRLPDPYGPDWIFEAQQVKTKAKCR